MSSLGENPPEQPEASTSASSSSRSQLCMICAAHPAIYTCPRCSARTCSLPCSNAHKQQGEGCSGVRNKAAYVPMNQYGYMALMNDYVFLEEVGRQVGEWGKEIVKGGFDARNAPRGMARGRGRGRGRGGASAASRTKRDVLKMQLDFRDIEMELLPAGMERRTMNQSTWDFKYVYSPARSKCRALRMLFDCPETGLPFSPSNSAFIPPQTRWPHLQPLHNRHTDSSLIATPSNLRLSPFFNPRLATVARKKTLHPLGSIR